MRSREEYEEVMRLVADGHDDSQISRATGISRTTVRGWRRGTQRTADRSSGRCGGGCGSREHAAEIGDIYVYLLGQYLGDGMLSAYPRSVYRLRIVCTATYPRIIEELTGAMMAVRGSERVALYDRGGDVEVSAYWKHWVCLFPQHGPGPKWKRPIQLEDWQQGLVDSHPWQLLRGLIHSDGCRHVNTVRRPVAGEIKEYRYSRYMFTNASDDILALFTGACDTVGVHWTRTSERNVAVSRRADVARMDEYIGPKE
ncbi:MAG TPA: helix-turn-helix domain-containing protein, partial [Acidimicrobiia bacterium]|nr:helix-turn-helix domain-containing protein [Acidimicrobiia bacterium]